VSRPEGASPTAQGQHDSDHQNHQRREGTSPIRTRPDRRGLLPVCARDNPITAGSMLVTDEDPFRSDCPVEEVVSTGVAGTTALVVGVLAGLALVRSPSRARLGAIVFGALAITLSHSSGRALPGIFGAVAVWLARLTRGRRPLDGASRVFGVIGLCVAILNPTVVLGGELLHLLIVFVS
jgi:hypothetical protein